MHIVLIFGRLYHINSETDMHIFSIFGRMYHINSQFIVYAFAPSRVLFDLFLNFEERLFKSNLQDCQTKEESR